MSAAQQSLRAAGLLYKRNTVARRAAKWSLPSISNQDICLPTVQTIAYQLCKQILMISLEPHLVNTMPPLLHLLI